MADSTQARVLVDGILIADGKLAVGVSDADDRAVEDVAGQQGAADPGLHLPADEPAQRPRPVDRVEALPGDEAPGLGGGLQRHLPLAEPGPQVIEHEVTGWTRLRCGSVATVMLAVLLCYACPHARRGRRTAHPQTR